MESIESFPDSPFTLTIDWLAFTIPAGQAKEIMTLLGGDWSLNKTGFRGYPVSWIRADGARGVGKLGTGAPRKPWEVHVDLSAGIVSAWPMDRVRSVLKWIYAQQGQVTRIDCALDDRIGRVPLPVVRAALAAGQCVTRAERIQTITSGNLHGPHAVTGETVYFGSPYSQTILRVYDKQLEMKAKDRENWQEYGIRWELEIKKARAKVCARCLSLLEENDWREFLVGLLRSYVDFRDTSYEASEDDRYRAPVLDWYAELTERFAKGRLVMDKDEQTLTGVKRWVSASVAPMLAVICASPDGEEWLRREIVEGVSRWKDRHRSLLKRRSKGSRAGAAGGLAGGQQGGTGVSPDSPGSDA
jgi:DNA relaxase NicK